MPVNHANGNRMKNVARLLTAAVVAWSAPAALADIAIAEILEPAGSEIGAASFEQTPTGVLIYVELAGLPPGPHGIHLHAVGSCSPDFTAATGHINPDGAAHGLRHPDGPDSGDLPNLYVGGDGVAVAEFFTTRVSVSGRGRGDVPALLDEDGSALIIHEHRDDHLSQPIGGAGGRIACGVIVRR
ncbi:MAG: superoxide dismutase family protein [Spirochaetaceae bacterium]|nr:superoxide dismutase family protein [Spirochaetaceae bacterium]